MINNFSLDKSKIYPIGLGTFGYGDESLINTELTDTKQKEVIQYSLDKGINYIPIYLTYANGKASEILRDALNEYSNDVYLTFCSYPGQFTKINELEKAYNRYRDGLKKHRIKTFMLSLQMEGRFGREESTKLLEKVLSSGIDSIGLTNANLEQLNYYSSIFKEKLVLHELCHNFEIRIFEDLGILQRTRELNILPIVYQPLRRNRTALRKWPLLESIARKHNVTVNQVLLNWLVSIGMLPLVKSSNILRIDENISALNFQLTDEEIRAINEFKILWEIPELDWLNMHETERLYIGKLPNVFDEIFK